MKTGFVQAYANIPVKKYYRYHGIIRDCLIEPDPDPFEDWPISPPYGPILYAQIIEYYTSGWYRQEQWYYEKAWNAPVANTWGSWIGQQYDSWWPGYTIYRMCMVFDLSLLPANARILSGYIHLSLRAIYAATHFDIVIVSGGGVYPSMPGDLRDYNKNNWSGNLGSINTESLGGGNIELNSSGLLETIPGGLVRYGFRSSRDISGIAPTGQETVGITTGRNLNLLFLSYQLPL